MKSKFKITDFSPPPPPKMKKKNRFTIKELLQKKKKGKAKILQNMKKKRGFATANLSPQPIMRKKIKNNIIDARNSPHKPPRNSPHKPPRNSPPKLPRNSPPKPPRNSPHKPPRNSPPKRTKTKFTIEDIPSPPKRTKKKFTIEDIPSPPKQQHISPISSMSTSLSPSSLSTMCCSCNNTMSAQTSATCVWCQLYYHLEKCVSQNAKERNKHK